MQENETKRAPTSEEKKAAIWGLIVGALLATIRTPTVWGAIVRIAAHWPF